MKQWPLYLGLLLFNVFSIGAQAELTIEITEGVQSAHKIALVPFALSNTEEIPVNVRDIIQADLMGSGQFSALDKASMLSTPTQESEVNYRHWAVTGQDYLVIGEIKKEQALYKIQMELFDVVKKQQLSVVNVSVEARSLRMAAHHLSDAIYQKIIGMEGVFSTRIAYVTSNIKANKQLQYDLYVADYDGGNAVSIAQSREPIMSPAWSPNGQHLAYVSFENKVSEIFVQTLASGQRKSVAKYRGINGSPAWAPNGKQLAITLSKSGNSDIYVLTLANLSLRQLTRSWAIDTEAAWSPDGKSILFTSNRGRRPQLYVIPSDGKGEVERLTFSGDYNARGSFSSDGEKIVMVQGGKGSYRIALLDRRTENTTILTQGAADESPSFSPNGQAVIYARRKAGKEILSLVSTDGVRKQDIKNTLGSVREPAWAAKVQ